MFETTHAASGTTRGRSSRMSAQRRFLLIASAGLAVVLAVSGVGFLAASGTVSTTITASTASSTLVFPVSASAKMPTTISGLKYNTLTTHTLSSTPVLPGWTPAKGSAGSVTTAGDLAVINAKTATVQLSMFITNLAKLNYDYSSYALPVHIWKSGVTGSTTTWTTTVSSQYITSTSGYISVKLTAGYYYDVTITTGGSFFCQTTTTASAGALSPSFYFAAQPV